MPNCDFYAADADSSELLEFAFARCECQIFETYSPFGEELAEFSNTHIRGRLAVSKIGSRPVLPEASKHLTNGTKAL
jgi:hypothetical protein